MTFFWIVFVLGVPYLTAVIGDFYAAVNPWKAIVEGVESLTGRAFVGVVGKPERFGYYPALLLYVLFIWIELFARVTPRGLSIALVDLHADQPGRRLPAGKVGLVPIRRVLRRLLASDRQDVALGQAVGSAGKSGGSWRPALAHAVRRPAGRARGKTSSLVIFVLFMLSSTAFDGLHGTQRGLPCSGRGSIPRSHRTSPGRGAAVRVLDEALLRVAVARRSRSRRWPTWPSSAPASLREWAAAPPSRCAGSCCNWPSRWCRSRSSTTSLTTTPCCWRKADRSCASHLRPVRNRLEPLGTARMQIGPFVVDVNVIWHTQVALILWATSPACTWLTSRRSAVPHGTSCGPQSAAMLALMVLFTAFGLWILSLPLSIGG